MQAAANHASWQAQLSLTFEKKANKTVVTQKKHTGPLVIQKPFYPEGAPCHVYLLHPPGGLVGGDQLLLNVTLNAASQVLMTTPGAAKFYRSADAIAEQIQVFHVDKDSLLEWMPQETIIFDKSNARINTQINLKQNSGYIGWEIICLGRSASGEKFSAGCVEQKLQLSINDKPVFIERALFQGNDELLSAVWGLAKQPTAGTMIITPADQLLVNKIREQVQADNSSDSCELFSVTLMDNVLVCRYLGPHTESAKALFVSAWKIARPHVHNLEACIPRIWNT